MAGPREIESWHGWLIAALAGLWLWTTYRSGGSVLPAAASPATTGPAVPPSTGLPLQGAQVGPTETLAVQPNVAQTPIQAAQPGTSPGAVTPTPDTPYLAPTPSPTPAPAASEAVVIPASPVEADTPTGA